MFGYDGGGRLITSSVGSAFGTKTDDFQFDTFGNITTHSIDGGFPVTLSPSLRTNRLTGSGTGYDGLGNLIARPGETFTYDPLSRMTKYTGSSGSEEFLYDGAGERVLRIGQTTNTLSITAPSGSSLPAGSPNVFYSFTFQASGGSSPYAWSVNAGTLPAGFTLSSAGVLSGTTSQTGSWSFTVKVRDSGQAAREATKAVTLQIGGAQPLRFFTLNPCRLLDTRITGSGGPIVGGASPRTFVAAGVCGIPSNAKSLAANITVINPPSTAIVTLYPTGLAQPNPLTVSGLSRAGATRAVFAMVGINGPTAGSFSAVTDLPAGQSADIIVDISGYFAPPGAPVADSGSAKGGEKFTNAASSTTPTALGGVRFYTFRDEQHRLSTEYQQDAAIGTRVAKDYFYFGNSLVATSTIWGTQQGWHFFTTDHLGTPRLKTDLAGAVAATPKYRPFGEKIVSPLEQGPEFAGMERDAKSGDFYVHARFQRSSLGRFVSLDLVLGKPERPSSWNRYAYVVNNPVNNIDPTGLLGCKVGEKVVDCRVVVRYNEETSQGTLTVVGKVEKKDKILLKGYVVVGGKDHKTPTGQFHAAAWEKDHVSKKYGSAADTPWSKSPLGLNAFGPYQLHIKELERQGIWIHGTMGPGWLGSPKWNRFLSPTSHGCVRCGNSVINELHDLMPDPEGNQITITTNPKDKPREEDEE